MRRYLLPSIALIALLGSATLAIAQGHGRHGGPGGGGGFGGGGMRGPGGGAMHAPGGGSGMRMGPGGGGRSDFRAPRTYSGPRASQPSRGYHERSRRAERPVQRSERSRKAQQRSERARNAQSTSDRRRAQRDAGRTKPGEPNTERNRLSTGQKALEGRAAREAGQSGQEHRVSERHSEIQQARTRLGAEDRKRLHNAFNFDRARLTTKVKFNHHVGRRVPRHIRLFAIPIAVFDFFPYYRDYSYFVIDDEICIVDPRSYVIVDVIDQGYWSGGGRPQVAGLHLNAAEITLVRDSIPPDFPVADVRLRLALGAEIPDDVELHELPVIVLNRVPKLREYRFLMTTDQIVIVDPGSRSIALVIDKA